LISVLLRLDPTAAAEGRLVGRAELVESGRTLLVHDLEELLELVRGSLPPVRP
jgi:hypothetical protein